MANNITDICEAVASGIEGAVSLGAHTKWLYLSPPVVRADTGPILCVFVSETDFDLLQTEDEYQDSHVLTIEWYESAARAVDIGGGLVGQNLAQEALERSEAIINYLRTLAVGLPAPVTGQSEGTLQSAKYGLVEGMLWLCRVDFKVARWS